MLCEKCGCMIPLDKKTFVPMLDYCPNCDRVKLPIIKVQTCYIFRRTAVDGTILEIKEPIEFLGSSYIPQLGWASLEACAMPNKWMVFKKYLRYKLSDFLHHEKWNYELWTLNLNYIEDFEFIRVYGWDVIDKRPMKKEKH